MSRFDRIFAGSPPKIAKQEKAVIGLPDGEWISDGVYKIVNRYPIGSSFCGTAIVSPDALPSMIELGATARSFFLDLETTGLSGGTGTYAFLCGIGKRVDDEIVIAQLFLTSPAHELEWLAAIERELPDDPTIFTYNGRSFDLPLLSTRCVLCRRDHRWLTGPHIDLLLIVRKIYKRYLASCSLSSIETNVLNISRRGEDIPGALIPAIYGDFLDTRDAAPLSGVFYHNEIDILSLVLLCKHLDDVLHGRVDDGRELLGASVIWESAGRTDEAMALLDAACASQNAQVEALATRAFIRKKIGDVSAALADFKALLGALEGGARCDPSVATVYSCAIEIAKIEEHRLGTPDRALEHARVAERWLARRRYYLGIRWRDMHKDLMRRVERLERKIEKRQNKECEQDQH